MENEPTAFRSRSFAMYKPPMSPPRSSTIDVADFSEDHANNLSPIGHLDAKPDVDSITDETSLTEPDFSINYTDNSSLPIGHSTVQTIPRSDANSKPDASRQNDDDSVTQSGFSPSDTDNSSLTTGHSTVQTIPRSDAISKPDVSRQNDDVSVTQSGFFPSDTDNSSLTTGHSKSLDDLSPIQKSPCLSKTCVSCDKLDIMDNNSDEEDYVIPSLDYVIPPLDNSDKEGDYVIASLPSCSNEYLPIKSNSDVDGYAEVKDYTLKPHSNTSCADKKFLTRSDSSEYDYVQNFIPPTSPLFPYATCAKFVTLARSNSDVDGYTEVADFLTEEPPLSSSTTCIENDFHTRSNSDTDDYAQDFTLPKLPSSLNATTCVEGDIPIRSNSDNVDGYEDVTDLLLETPLLSSSTMCVLNNTL